MSHSPRCGRRSSITVRSRRTPPKTDLDDAGYCQGAKKTLKAGLLFWGVAAWRLSGPCVNTLGREPMAHGAFMALARPTVGASGTSGGGTAVVAPARRGR